MRVRSLVGVVSALALALAVAQPASARGLVVQTRSGAVAGRAVGPVDEWLGIPYAAPPVGDLRWRSPAPVAPWSGVLSATRFGPECPQLRFTHVEGREDCLHLNVFAPAGGGPAAGLPVMVHLHPGSNTFGRAFQEVSWLVSRGVIVVTVDYRLGILGFIGSTSLSREQGGTSGEYGLLDQIAALQWVHDNIAGFGGDPDEVTLFGSSAGSFDTVALVASPLTEGLIARGAVQADYFPMVYGTHNDINLLDKLGDLIAQQVGCVPPDVLACVRAKPAEALVEATGFQDLWTPVGGQVLPEPPIDLLAHHAPIPLLIGFDREEDAAFRLPGLPDPYRYRNWLADTEAIVGAQRAPTLRALYPPEDYDTLAWDYITAYTDAVRGCPTRHLARVAPGPTYRWLYTHVMENDPGLAAFRASHVMEDQFLFHDYFFSPGYVPSAGEELLSARMADYWTNFAKTGDPNGPGLPLWPGYEEASDLTLTLDDEIGVVAGYHAEQCAFLDTIPWPIP
jgi:para-nitrobenzyl esterase